MIIRYIVSCWFNWYHRKINVFKKKKRERKKEEKQDVVNMITYDVFLSNVYIIMLAIVYGPITERHKKVESV